MQRADSSTLGDGGSIPNAELSGGEAVRSDDLLGEPMVHYAHQQDPKGMRFRQYAKEKIPAWAVDVQPCTPDAESEALT